MRQYAWLDFHGGCWYLVMANTRISDRKWASRDAALSDLTAEGWVIDGPDGKRPIERHEADRHFYGYALRRTIH